MFRRLLITAVSAAVFGCALVSCGDGAAGSGEPLRWRTAIDVPVNFSLPVDFEPMFPGCKEMKAEPLYSAVFVKYKINCDSVLSPTQQAAIDSLIDVSVAKMPPDTYFIQSLDTGTVPTTSDVMDILRKLEKPEIRYSVGIEKSLDEMFTVYGMFFPTDDSLAKVRDSVFYKMVKRDSITGKRVNVLDTSGLDIGGGSIKCYPKECSELTDTNSNLDTLVLGLGLGPKDKKAFAWRWLVKLNKDEYNKLRKSPVMTDTVKIRIRINFSGVNSVDSLIKMFD